MARIPDKKKRSQKNTRIIDRIKDPDLMIVSRSFVFSIIGDYSSDPDQILQTLEILFRYPDKQNTSKMVIQ